MGDALCGPSNALQSFKNHSQVDRSLQQDRISSPRHSDVQGFRTPDPRAGSLDGEFAAFEAGHQQAFHLPQQPLQPFPSLAPVQPFSQLPAQGHAPAAPGWAADFQQLHLGPPQTWSTPHNHFGLEAAVVRSSPGRVGSGLQNDFIRQHQQQEASNANGKQVIRPQTSRSNYVQTPPVSQYSFAPQPPGLYSGTLQQPKAQTGMHDPLREAAAAHDSSVANNAAFEAAFALAAASETTHTSPQQQQQESPPSTLTQAEQVTGVGLNPTTTFLQPAPLSSQSNILIGSDTIPHHPDNSTTTTTTKPITPAQAAQNANELARTAGQLLQSVAHDMSPKFQNSQFLQLMRRIRDREVEVQGEEFCEVQEGAEVMNGDGGGATILKPHPHQEVVVADEEAGTGQKDMADRAPMTLQELVSSSTPLSSSFSSAAVGGWTLEERREEIRRRHFTQLRVNAEGALASDLHPGGKGYPADGEVAVVGERAVGLEELGGGGVGGGELGGADRGLGPVGDRHRFDHWASGGIGVEDESS